MTATLLRNFIVFSFYAFTLAYRIHLESGLVLPSHLDPKGQYLGYQAREELISSTLTRLAIGAMRTEEFEEE